MFAYRTHWAAGDGLPGCIRNILAAVPACWLVAASLGTPGVYGAETTGANAPASAAETAAIVVPADVRYCSQPQVLVRYRWTGAAPKGVQMWISVDGTRWLPWAWSDKPTEPFAFNPPRQGKILLALAAADVETAVLPSSGYQSLAIVFDFEKPLLRLTGSNVAKSRPALQLSWAAYDENFGERPMSLHWRHSTEEPWQQAITDLPNNGACEWTIPPPLAGKTIEVCLRATDLAGNTAEAVTSVTTKGAEVDTVPITKAPPKAPPNSRPATQNAPADPAQPAQITTEAERLCQLAQQHLTQNEFDMAEDLFREAEQTDPTYYAARLNLGILLQRRSRHAEAIGEYQTVLSLKPDNVTAWRNLALAFMTTKDYPKTRITLQKLLAIEADNPQTYIDLGDVEMLMGRSETAKQCWEKAQSLSKPNTETAARAGKRLAVYVRQK